ncbi:hypothetical protein C7E25_24790, partial [Stenotrophomonas maltophilia]
RKHCILLAAAVLAGCSTTTAPRTGSEVPTPSHRRGHLRQGRKHCILLAAAVLAGCSTTTAPRTGSEVPTPSHR